MGATYMECSSKERIGVDDIFDQAIVMATEEENDVEDGPVVAGTKPMAKGRRKRINKKCKIL